MRFPLIIPRLCIYSRPRAICNNWRRDEAVVDGKREKIKIYQIKPPDVLVMPQIPSEVHMIHKSEDEGKRVLPS